MDVYEQKQVLALSNEEQKESFLEHLALSNQIDSVDQSAVEFFLDRIKKGHYNDVERVLSGKIAVWRNRYESLIRAIIIEIKKIPDDVVSQLPALKNSKVIARKNEVVMPLEQRIEIVKDLLKQKGLDDWFIFYSKTIKELNSIFQPEYESFAFLAKFLLDKDLGLIASYSMKKIVLDVLFVEPSYEEKINYLRSMVLNATSKNQTKPINSLENLLNITLEEFRSLSFEGIGDGNDFKVLYCLLFTNTRENLFRTKPRPLLESDIVNIAVNLFGKTLLKSQLNADSELFQHARKKFLRFLSKKRITCWSDFFDEDQPKKAVWDSVFPEVLNRVAIFDRVIPERRRNEQVFGNDYDLLCKIFGIEQRKQGNLTHEEKIALIDKAFTGH